MLIEDGMIEPEFIKGFETIAGHRRILMGLASGLDAGSIGHGYLFCGIEGIGKFMVARELARHLLCSSDERHGSGDTGCSACLKFDTGNHPDMMIIEPDGMSIKNKQVETFQEFIMIRPNEGQRKVVIFRNADTMTASAQNRLLKILEEPPAYAAIFLTADNPANVLPTIVSRSRILEFERLNESELIYLGKSVFGKSADEVSHCVDFADGSVSSLRKLLEQEDFQEMRQETLEMPGFILNKMYMRASELAVKYSAKRESCLEFLDLLQTIYRDILILAMGSGVEIKIFNRDMKSKLLEYGSSYGVESLISSLEQIEETRKSVKANVGLATAMEVMVLKLLEVGHG